MRFFSQPPCLDPCTPAPLLTLSKPAWLQSHLSTGRHRTSTQNTDGAPRSHSPGIAYRTMGSSRWASGTFGSSARKGLVLLPLTRLGSSGRPAGVWKSAHLLRCLNITPGLEGEAAASGFSRLRQNRPHQLPASVRRTTPSAPASRRAGGSQQPSYGPLLGGSTSPTPWPGDS